MIFPRQSPQEFRRDRCQWVSCARCLLWVGLLGLVSAGCSGKAKNATSDQGGEHRPASHGGAQSIAAPPPLREKFTEEVDLLRSFDIRTHVINGKARRDNWVLTTNSLEVPSLIRLPTATPTDYEIEAQVTRIEGDGPLFFAIRVADQRCMVLVDGRPERGHASGISLIDNRGPADPKYPVRAPKGALLTNNQPATIRCQVRGRDVTLLLDDAEIFQWSADPQRLSLAPFFAKVPEDSLFIGSSRSRFRIDRLVMNHRDDWQPDAPHGELAETSGGEPATGPEVVESWDNDAELWSLVPAHSADTSTPYENELATWFQDDQALLVEVRQPLDSLHLVHAARFSGDFKMRLKVVMPSSKDPDVAHSGGTAIPYFGVRSCDTANLTTTTFAPRLSAERKSVIMEVRRESGNVEFVVDDEVRKSVGHLAEQPCQVFIHLNPSSKIWIEGYQIEGEFAVASTSPAAGKVGSSPPIAQPSPAPLGPVIAVEEWKVESLEDERTRHLISEHLLVQREAEGIRVQVEEETPPFWLIHGDAIEGDFLATLRIVLPARSAVPVTRSRRSQIIVGGLPARAPAQSLRLTLPQAGEQRQEVQVEIQRLGSAISSRVNGRLTEPPVFCQPAVKLGLSAEGETHFWIADYDLKKLPPERFSRGDAPGITAGEPLEEIKLPAPVEHTALAAGGERLLLSMTGLGKVAVFDLVSAKIEYYLPLDDPQSLVTGSVDRVFIGSSRDKQITSYRIDGGELDQVIPWTWEGELIHLSCGHAARGPVLAAFRKANNGTEVRWLDGHSLGVMDFELDSQSPPIARDESTFVRASANGQVFGVSSRQAQSIVLGAGKARVYSSVGEKVALPSPAGVLIYTDVELCNQQLRPSRPEGLSLRGTLLPATREPFFLSVHTPASYTSGDSTVHRVALHMLPVPHPIAVFSDLRVPGRMSLGSRKRPDLSLDERLVCHPPSGTIVAVGPSNDRLLVKRFNLDAILQESKRHHLQVTSLPPTVVTPGGRFEYRPTILSSSPAQISLTAGPAGMQVTADGLLQWDVPADAAGANETVILTLLSDDHADELHSFAIQVDAPEALLVGLDSSFPKPPPPPPPSPVIENPDALEVELPSPFAQVAVGGGGRFLVLHLPKVGQLAIVDLQQREISRFIPLEDHDARITAGRSDVVALLPSRRRVQRWDLLSGELRRETNLPGDDRAAFISLGADSMGPILVGIEQNDAPGIVLLLDRDTLQARKALLEGEMRLAISDAMTIRTSADGGLLTALNTDDAQAGVQMLVRSGQSLQTQHLSGAFGYAAPDAAGETLLTYRGPLSLDGRSADVNFGPATSTIPIPASLTSFTARLHQVDNRQPEHADSAKIDLYFEGLEKPFIELPAAAVRPANANDRFAQDAILIDQRVHFAPHLGRLATLPTSNDRVVIYSLNIPAALEATGKPFLYVSSRLENEPQAGNEWTYQIQTHCQPGMPTFELESGPQGMLLSPEGQLSWQVPATADAGTHSVIVSINHEETGKSFHTLVLRVLPAGTPGVDAADESEVPNKSEPEVEPDKSPGEVIDDRP